MAEVFRQNKRLKVPYWQQGYIFFVSRKYDKLPAYQQEWIREHCQEVGGDYWKALFEYMTTDIRWTAVCLKHYISETTLRNIVRRYYEQFPDLI